MLLLRPVVVQIRRRHIQSLHRHLDLLYFCCGMFSLVVSAFQLPGLSAWLVGWLEIQKQLRGKLAGGVLAAASDDSDMSNTSPKLLAS
jgi:hypothetical protein